MTIEEVCKVLERTLLSKNEAYGNAAAKEPIFLPLLSSQDAILVRMSDKVSRLANLRRSQCDDNGESFNDTILDLAGYCVLYLVSAANNAK